jgi:hypothetical protein
MNTSSWKWFRYDEIFDIRKGKRLTKENMTEGDIRYIGAIDSNNGLSAFIGNDSQLHQGNTISVSYNGSIGYAFYQDKEFWATDDVNVLYPKFLLNKYIAMFLCHLIEKEQYRFCYGRKWDLEAMNKSKIKLPVTPDGTPDWKYMEDFVKDQIIPQLPKKAQKVWLQKYDTKPQKREKMKLNTDEWKWFSVENFCEYPYKAKAYNANELTECLSNDPKAILYVTRTDVNNGCKGYVVNDGFEAVERGNAITIGDTTSTIFYQNKDFICGDHMVVLRSKFFNIYTGLFITALLNKERFRYNYGRAFTMDIIAKTRIKLPTIPSGEPDWKFMEDYIKSLPYSKNIEPSKPNEVVDELMEVKKEMIKMRRAMEAQQSAEVHYHIDHYNDNSTTYNIKK